MTMLALDTIQSLLNVGDLIEPPIGAVTYSAGSRIFDQDEPGDCAYMIDSGYVEVSRDDDRTKTVLAVLGPGEIFGEMSLLDGQPRSATATAVHETTVLVISRQQLLEAVNDGNPLVRLVLIASINRLRTTQLRSIPAGETHDPRLAAKTQADTKYEAARHQAADQLRLQFELENAIANRQFELAYQPIVALADGRTGGFEALIRWPRPGGQIRSPLDFIPVAEASGLIVPLGLWILESALQALSAFDQSLRTRRTGGAGVFMSVNVSPRQLDSEDDVEQLARMIEQADIDPGRIKLEITEQVLLSDPRMAAISLARLKATGVSLAIDDFGTGYSSLSYLHRFPLDTLKVDRSFVTKIADDPGAQRVVAAIIGLAHELGMDVVAEGIEELEELRWLQSHRCRYGQGYLMAKPASFTHALTYLERDFEW